MVCHMENITVDSNNNKLGSTPSSTIMRSLSQVQTDPDVQLAMETIQKLIEKWYAEDNPPAPVPTPDPTTDTTPDSTTPAS